MDGGKDLGAIKTNLVNGFGATGIFPFDPARVLNKLPSNEFTSPGDHASVVGQALVSFLEKQRFGDKSEPKRKKRTRLNVVPGKSVAAKDSSEESAELPEPDRKCTSEHHIQYRYWFGTIVGTLI